MAVLAALAFVFFVFFVFFWAFFWALRLWCLAGSVGGLELQASLSSVHPSWVKLEAWARAWAVMKEREREKERAG